MFAVLHPTLQQHQVDADNVEANLEEGILRVQVRKSEKARPRRIEITAG
ncbi:Hsp20 family protein [Corynebacterium flavescens]